MFDFTVLWWVYKIVLSTVFLILLFIIEIFVVKYTSQKNESKTKNIFIGNNEKNPEKFLLENYKYIKNSGKYGNIILISSELEKEQEEICKIFSKEKDITYINISELK